MGERGNQNYFERKRQEEEAEKQEKLARQKKQVERATKNWGSEDLSEDVIKEIQESAGEEEKDPLLAGIKDRALLASDKVRQRVEGAYIPKFEAQEMGMSEGDLIASGEEVKKMFDDEMRGVENPDWTDDDFRELHAVLTGNEMD